MCGLDLHFEKQRKTKALEPWVFFFCCECVGCLASSFDCAFEENSRLGAPKFLCGLLKEVGVLDPNVFLISNGHSKLEASSFFFLV